MKATKLKDMSIDQLIDRFVEISIAQDEAKLMDEITKVNRLYLLLMAVDAEQRARGKDARLALLSLYDHPNLQVRLNAAKLSLGIAPVEARKVIQAVKDLQWMPQSLEAGMTLRNLDNGVFKPD